MANTLLSDELLAPLVGSSSSGKQLMTAETALNTYGVAARYTGNEIVAEPLCYGVYFYFSNAYIHTSSAGCEYWTCYIYNASSPTTTYIHKLTITVPEGYGLPTSYNVNGLFGVNTSCKTAAKHSFKFEVKMVGKTLKTTNLSFTQTNWIGTGGRVWITIASDGSVSSPSYYAPSTTYINAAKSSMSSGFTAADLDCMDQTHVLRT